MVFGAKLREEQKKTGLHSDFVRFVLKLSALVTKGGGPCRNFTRYSMLIILNWRPKGVGPWCHGLPFNTPLVSTYIISSDLFYCLLQWHKKFSSAMSQIKNSKRNATFTIAEVALDIFLHVARQRSVTAKRSLLKIACLMTVSFRPSWDHIHNLN